jgi:hypothetical protein
MGSCPACKLLKASDIHSASGLPILGKRIKMKRLYTKILTGTQAGSESSLTLTGLLAAFLSGVLCCMFINWLLF